MAKKQKPAAPWHIQIARIQVRRIREFERRCRTAGYTDTGDAWDMLHAIRDDLKEVK